MSISKPYGFLRASFGNVLFTASKAQYNAQRPLLKLIFSNERMRGYLKAMNAEVDRWLAGLGDEGELDISAAMLRLTQYVAAHAFLGPNFRSELGEEFWDASEFSNFDDSTLRARRRQQPANVMRVAAHDVCVMLRAELRNRCIDDVAGLGRGQQLACRVRRFLVKAHDFAASE